MESSDIEVTVESLNQNYADAMEDVSVIPSVEHLFTVTDGNDAISTALATLASDNNLSELNLPQQYQADANGQFSLLLPDDENSYELTISADGFTSQTLSLNAGLTDHDVAMSSMSNAITLSGSISALGTQDFSRNPPSMSLTFSDLSLIHI